MQPSILKKLIETVGHIPNPETRPKRCRAIVFNLEGTKILGIGRIRPGRDPYVVYPGGGLEEYDSSAKDGVWRELGEELGLTQEQVQLTDSVIDLDGEFFYLGYAPVDIDGLTIGVPEAESNESSGQYLPGWYTIPDLIDFNTLPVEVSQILVDANEQ